MAHLYDKLPPAFAKDPWAWDYTRDRIEGNTGLPYDQWQGKHFAGAAAMYKNVVKKYNTSIAAGEFSIPKECIDCGETVKHYVDDYVCADCRDKIENAGSYHEAEQTITRPEALDDIRDQLAEALGHKAKDRKKNKAMPVDAVSTMMVEQTAPADSGMVSRNYSAMGDYKLKTCIAELEKGEGDAVRRAIVKGEDINDHLEAALRAAQTKGVAV